MRIAVLLLLACACGGPATTSSAESTARDENTEHACTAGAPTSDYDLWPVGDRCAVLDQRWAALPASARSCSADSDCGLVSGPCFDEALRKEVIESGYAESPCVHPAAGMCPPSGLTHARCVNGCCAPAR